MVVFRGLGYFGQFLLFRSILTILVFFLGEGILVFWRLSFRFFIVDWSFWRVRVIKESPVKPK